MNRYESPEIVEVKTAPEDSAFFNICDGGCA